MFLVYKFSSQQQKDKRMCVCVSVCVYLEDLEAVDVEDTDVELLMVLLHGFIDALLHTHTYAHTHIHTGESWVVGGA